MRSGPQVASARGRWRLAWLVFLLAWLGAATLARAQAFTPQPVHGRVVLRLRPPASGTFSEAAKSPDLELLHTRFAVSRCAPLFDGPGRGPAKSEVRLASFYVVDFPPEQDLEMVRGAYAALPEVESAELDWMHPLLLETDDFAGQWHLESTSGRDAHVTGGWNHSIGDTSVVLAIADSGVDWMHPDLGGSGPGGTGGNIWTNWVEFHGTGGVDDDGNGKVDDVRGWDFVSNLNSPWPAWPGEDSSQPDADPRDFNGHGTHVAGIAGARTNNGDGVAGVGFRCRILPLRIGGSVHDPADPDGLEQGVVFMTYAAQAIRYATLEGATAINCSWGSSFDSFLAAAVDDAVAAGVIVVAAAGNDNHDLPSYLGSRGDCLDVAATTPGDVKATFSNFGSWVDIAAPGVDILSTYYDHNADQHGYRLLQGTSMAAPVVTGLVGLVKARYPFLRGALLRQQILAGADDLDASDPEHAGMLGRGRVNALRTFDDRFLTIPGDYPSIAKALAASGAGDTLAVRGGVPLGPPLLVQKSGRTLLGGWDANFTSRDPGNPSLIEVNGTGPCLEFGAAVDSTTVVDSFRFSGGAARFLSDPSGRFGGGVLCIDASPVLRHCTFSGNRSGDAAEAGGGGGGFFARSQARLVDCHFLGNSASRGAGLYLLDAMLHLEQCRAEKNQAPAAAGSRGGGVYLDGGTLVADGLQLADNGLVEEGGGIYARAARLLLRNARCSTNLAVNGGGIALREGSTLELVASVLWNNRANQLGGGLYGLDSQGELSNVTLHANHGLGGALFVQRGSGPWGLSNSICSGHGSTALFFFATTASLDYNLYWANPSGDLQGATYGAHDLVADPLFVDATAGDVALGLHSPALDSGEPAAGLADPDGSRNDRGAFGGPLTSRRTLPAPQLLAARHIGGVTTVAWTPNTEADVASYAVYRGPDSDFVPAALTYVGSAAASQTSFADPNGSEGDWYRLAAVDGRGASSGFRAALRSETQDLLLPVGPSLSTREHLPSTPAAPPTPVFTLHPGNPNPSNPSTRLAFELPVGARARLEILDVRGRLVRLLVDGPLPAGPGAVDWDGRDRLGREAPSGVYVVRFAAATWCTTRKLTLVR